MDVTFFTHKNSTGRVIDLNIFSHILIASEDLRMSFYSVESPNYFHRNCNSLATIKSHFGIIFRVWNQHSFMTHSFIVSCLDVFAGILAFTNSLLLLFTYKSHPQTTKTHLCLSRAYILSKQSLYCSSKTPDKMLPICKKNFLAANHRPRNISTLSCKKKPHFIG